MASKAISFKEALDPSFKAYAKQIIENAQTLAKRFKSKGVSLITDGTDNHLLLIDVQKNFGLNGRQAESLLSSLGCTVNRNSIPNDPNGAWYCSGIRIGTPALTTRGFKNEEIEKIADILYDVLKEAKPNGMAESVISENVRSRAKREIDELLQNKPLYPEIKTGDLVHV
jgi:glycine hydroxymethyltransferase